MSNLIMGFLAAFAVLMGLASASAQTITVGTGPGYDFSSIQAAIDAATNGDTIIVAPGYYVEGTSPYSGNNELCGLNFNRKTNLILQGAGALDTIVDFGNVPYGLMLDSSNGITISGLTMKNSCRTLMAVFNSSGIQDSNLISYCVLDFSCRPADPNYIKYYHAGTFYDHVTFVGPPSNTSKFFSSNNTVSVYISNSIFYNSPALAENISLPELHVDHSNFYLVDRPNFAVGTEITYLDPKFVNAAADDFRLAFDSPLKNLASDGTYLGALPPIPEPATLSLLALGGLAAMLCRCRKR